MTIPYLGGVLKKHDTAKKGKFDYAAWSVICNYLNESGKGNWQPGIRITNGLPYVPCGIGAAVLIYFKEYETDRETPDWLYEITDYKNNPIPLNKLTCSDVHRAHKRGLCSAAAGFFSLGYEIWAKLELAEMDKALQDEPPRDNNAWRKNNPTIPATHTHPKQEIPQPVSPEDRQSIISDLTSLFMANKTRFRKFESEYRAAFPDCEKGQLLSEHIQTQEQADFVTAWFIKNGPPDLKHE